ncbi:hypothetical protein K439DRAFT_1657686 [Ramaria rubella]|nr:hypothetical protein K439DRAFT_1657686 [Ramaria rubella]
MKRVGYDAETQRYTFRGGDELWLGEPGSFHGGKLERVGKARDAGFDEFSDKDDTESDTSLPEDDELGSSSSVRPHTHRLFSNKSHPNQNNDPWGVPVVSISETGAAPPDIPKENIGLRRRATQFKKIATSTAKALGVLRRTQKENARQNELLHREIQG